MPGEKGMDSNMEGDQAPCDCGLKQGLPGTWSYLKLASNIG